MKNKIKIIEPMVSEKQLIKADLPDKAFSISEGIEKRELLITTATHSFTVFPDHMNYAGALFGGKILAEIDIAAIKTVRRMLYYTDCDAAVTASIDRVNFLKPADLGDIIEMTATIYKLGRTSINVFVHVTKENQQGGIETICDASLVFVSLRNGVPYPHNHYLKTTSKKEIDD
jgi:acyl-CoA hydrolase